MEGHRHLLLAQVARRSRCSDSLSVGTSEQTTVGQHKIWALTTVGTVRAKAVLKLIAKFCRRELGNWKFRWPGVHNGN